MGKYLIDEMKAIESQIDVKAYPAIKGLRTYMDSTKSDNYIGSVLLFKDYIQSELNNALSQSSQNWRNIGKDLMRSKPLRHIVQFVMVIHRHIPEKEECSVEFAAKYPNNQQELIDWIVKLQTAVTYLTPELAQNLEEYDYMAKRFQQSLTSNYIPSNNQYTAWIQEFSFSGISGI